MKKLWILLIPLLSLGCQDDNISDDNGSLMVGLDRSSEVKMSIQVDVEVSEFLSCVNPEDRELMTDAEKVLSVPKPRRYKALYYFKEDGLIDANIEYYTSPDMIQFPENTIGLHQLSERFRAERIEIRDGRMTRYDKDGVEINSDQINHDISAIIEDLVQGMSENVHISDQEFDAILEAFNDSGFILTNSTDETAVLSHIFPDNTKVSMLVDKQARKVSARSNFNATGDVVSSSSLIYSNNLEDLNAYVYSTYYESPNTMNKMAYSYFVKVFDQEIKTY